MLYARNRIDQQLGELEKEKMMRELEVKELYSQHRAEIRNMELQLSGLKVSILNTVRTRKLWFKDDIIATPLIQSKYQL